MLCTESKKKDKKRGGKGSKNQSEDFNDVEEVAQEEKGADDVNDEDEMNAKSNSK